jgi:hypothetical protein
VAIVCACVVFYESGAKSLINYRKFATSASKMINKLFDVNEQRIRADVRAPLSTRHCQNTSWLRTHTPQ